MRYWYCKDKSDGQTWLYMGTIRPVKDESEKILLDNSLTLVQEK